LLFESCQAIESEDNKPKRKTAEDPGSDFFPGRGAKHYPRDRRTVETGQKWPIAAPRQLYFATISADN
jgi:hypothetical protein